MTDEDRTGWHNWVLDILKTQGVATVLLGVMVYGIWSMVSWSADNIATPLVHRQLEMMSTMESTARLQAESLKIQKELLISLNDNAAESARVRNQIQETVSLTQTTLLQLIKNLEQNISNNK